MTWRPHHTEHGGIGSARPSVGDVVAYARAAWQVTRIEVTDPAPEEQETINHYVAPYRDQSMPYRVTLHRLHGPTQERENSRQDIGLRVRVAAYNPLPRYKDGRVPLCSCCGHPWPCLESDQQAEARKGAAMFDRELNLLPGCCPACQEPITGRQRSITFPGPYLRNPLANNGPAFHLRRSCSHEAARYEEEWVAADPSRARSLLTLRCEGTVIVHGDGDAECYGAVGSDCPSIHAHHRGYSACYIESHGCGRGCTPQGHPGTRVAGRPLDPRETEARP